MTGREAAVVGLIRSLAAALVLILAPEAGQAGVPVQTWGKTWADTTSYTYGPPPAAAKELADGSTMVVGPPAIRYDRDGNVLSVAGLSAPYFSSLTSSGSQGLSQASLVAIDSFGGVFIASVLTTSVYGGPSNQGDIWLMKYDGLTGKTLWSAPALFDLGRYSREFPVRLLLDSAGNPVVVGTTRFKTILLKYDGVTGAPLWQPIVLDGRSPLAAIDPAGNLIVKVELSVYKFNGQTGTMVWGPILTGDLTALSVGPDGDYFVAATESGRLAISRYSGADGSAVWGPAFHADTTSTSPKATDLVVNAAGDLIASGIAGDHFVVLKYSGAAGSLIWGPLTPKTASFIPLTVRVAGNGDVVASGWADYDVLEAWRYNGVTGSVIWGPQLFPGARQLDNRRPMTLILSDSRILMTASTSSSLSTLARDPMTGAPVWGPVPFTQTASGGVRVTDVSQDLQGDVLVTGYTSGGRYATVKCARSDGSILWGPVFSAAPAYPMMVRADASADVFVLGATGDVHKYSGATGALIWEKTPGVNLQGWRMAIDASGDVFVLEQLVKGTFASEYDFVIFKLSGATGTTLWGPVIFDRGPGTSDWPDAIAITPGGDVVVAGISTSSNYTASEWVTVKYAGATGSLMWGPSVLPQPFPLDRDSVEDLVIDAAGDIAVVGSSYMDEATRMTTIKYEGTTGAVLWGPLTVPGDGRATAAALDTDGNLFVTGYVYDGQGPNFATIKYRGSDGVVLWGPQFFDGSGHANDYAYGLALDSTGNPVVAGTTVTASHARAVAIVKYDGSTGAPLWDPVIDGGIGQADLPLHNLIVYGNSAVIAGSLDRYLAAAYDEVFGIQTLPQDVPRAYCGRAYTKMLVAGNATGSVTWSLVSGSLPSGLFLAPSTGLISGTPTGVGSFSFRVRAQDSVGTAAERDVVILVGHGSPFVPIVASSNPVCAGQSTTLSVAGSWTAYQWLPGGETTPTISVSPTEAMDYGVILTDASGCPARGQVRIAVRSHLAIRGPAAACAAQAGYRAVLDDAVAGATYEWSIVNGTITSGAGTAAVTFAAGSAGFVQLGVTVAGDGCLVGAAILDVPIGACAASPEALAVDAAANSHLSDGNGLLEPGETVIVNPAWKNVGPTPLALTGVASGVAGPAGSSYEATDAMSDYGTVAPDSTNDCGATANCYKVFVSTPITRPATHWDATFTETLSDGDPAKVWTLHIGKSFTDVSKTHVFYTHVERLLHNGVTTGCGPAAYCPEDPVSRLQMAIFIARAQAGSDAGVPPSGTAQGSSYDCTGGGTSLFSDVEPTDPFCRHVHYIYGTGVTTGCESGKYCPGPDVSRAQMAMFVARAMAGSDAAVPPGYGPDPGTGRSYNCTSGSPNLHFTDVTTEDIFCRHTHYLWAKDVISGFPDNSYQPGSNVTRGAMAKFLSNGFALKLYGP